MKVGELRKVVEKYNKKELTYIVAEMYKAFPKKMLEEKNIDFIIENPNPSKSTKEKKKTVKMPDMDALYDEVSEFCKNAMQQLYYVQNRTIPKKERTGWRFKVIKMYKDLMIASSLDENINEVTFCITELYKTLCYACDYYVFASKDPFYTIKIPQKIFLQETLKLNKKHLSDEEFAIFNIKLAIENDRDYETCLSEIIEESIKFLETDKQIRLGIAACETLIQEIKKLKDKWDEHSITSRIDDIAEFGFYLYMKINEGDKAISFF